MRTHASTALVAAFLLAASGLSTGCGAPNGPAAIVPADFNLTDRAWLELMIPMDEKVLPALELVAARSADPAVRAFATDAAASVHSELDELRRLGGEANLPADNPHAGMKMIGLVDATTLAALKSSPATGFTALALRTLRENVDQTASLARSESHAGAQPDTTALAARAEALRVNQGDRLLALGQPPLTAPAQPSPTNGS